MVVEKVNHLPQSFSLSPFWVLDLELLGSALPLNKAPRLSLRASLPSLPPLLLMKAIKAGRHFGKEKDLYPRKGRWLRSSYLWRTEEA